MKIEIPPLLLSLLEDPKVTDICINRHDLIFIDQGNGMEPFPFSPPLFKNESDYRHFILEQISLSGKTWDAKLPFLDTLFFESHRAHVAFPPLAPLGIHLSLRKLPQRNQNLTRAKETALARWKDQFIAFQMLQNAIFTKETIMIAGGTGSGKTTLLNDLLTFIPEHERIITLEDTAEIAPGHPHYLSLLTRHANADGYGSVTLKELLRQTLRMRPDRILIGECRGDEVLDLLQALNTGHRGTLSTLHANSARDALRRIELLALIGAKGTIPSALIKELMAGGIQKLVFLERINGSRKISAILQLEGKEKEILFTRPLFTSHEYRQ